jgi:hypothetical protein
LFLVLELRQQQNIDEKNPFRRGFRISTLFAEIGKLWLSMDARIYCESSKPKIMRKYKSTQFTTIQEHAADFEKVHKKTESVQIIIKNVTRIRKKTFSLQHKTLEHKK